MPVLKLKPWYKVVTPREDLRDQKPLDAAEFAAHLDQVRDGRAPSVYQEPVEFFDRTYLTQKMTELAVEVLRRLSGEINEASAVFNLATQFGGGKTHALTMLYHLAENGKTSHPWPGVKRILGQASLQFVPHAKTAVFVGQQFDSIRGRGGSDGTPLRKTPWGEIAFQLGGATAFAVVAEHDERGIAPGGDVIREMLPADYPCLILMDEVMNYINHARKQGLSGAFYNFIQNLSEEARSRSGVALVVSIPASDLEMSADDERDFQSIKKLLDRLGKPIIISAEHETSEIIRRRLFEWQDLNDEAKRTIRAYADWATEHSQQLSDGLSGDKAYDVFAATYPFHPSVLSVFERKWQALPRFQRTRGVLQLLARWVSHAYKDGYSGAQQDTLIDLGSAPLDDPDFRTAVFGQLGEERLEAAVTTDIAGKHNSHAILLDNDAQDTLKKARLHRKVATTIFFESNGGQTRMEATIPEIRLGVGFPDLDIGNVETALDALGQACYYLSIDRNRYRFSTRENLIKKHSDYRASITDSRITERIEAEIQSAFKLQSAMRELPLGSAFEIVPFPESSSAVTNVPQITLVILSPNYSVNDPQTMRRIETWTRENGASARTFKNALVWCIADDTNTLRESAKKTIAWEDIFDELEDSPRGPDGLDELQRRQLHQYVEKSRGDLREAVWRTYRHVALLGKDGELKVVNLGLVHSSAATTPINLIINRLIQLSDIETGIGVNFLLRNWPPAFQEWDTRSVRNAFFASPQFPRLLNPNAICETIAKGVSEGHLAYVSRPQDGEYLEFRFGEALSPSEVKFTDDMCIIKAEVAKAYVAARQQKKSDIDNDSVDDDSASDDSNGQPDDQNTTDAEDPVLVDQNDNERLLSVLVWRGDIPAQKWTMFYNKVLSRFAVGQNLRISVQFEVQPPDGVSQQKYEEAKLSLRELGLPDDVDVT